MKPTKEMIETTANALAAAFKAYEDEEYIHVENIENAAIDGYFDLHDVAEKFLAAMPGPAVTVPTGKAYRDLMDTAIATYEANTPPSYRYSAIALTKAVEAAISALTPATDLAAENERLRECGMAELAASNPNAMEYVKHWEGRAEAAEARIAELEKRLADAERVIEPFAEDIENWTDENGWTQEAPKNDRICEWFGPSAFRAARAYMEGK